MPCQRSFEGHPAHRAAHGTALGPAVASPVAAGITLFLQNGDVLEKAQMMAAPENPQMTTLYDRN